MKGIHNRSRNQKSARFEDFSNEASSNDDQPTSAVAADLIGLTRSSFYSTDGMTVLGDGRQLREASPADNTRHSLPINADDEVSENLRRCHPLPNLIPKDRHNKLDSIEQHSILLKFIEKDEVEKGQTSAPLESLAYRKRLLSTGTMTPAKRVSHEQQPQVVEHCKPTTAANNAFSVASLSTDGFSIDEKDLPLLPITDEEHFHKGSSTEDDIQLSDDISSVKTFMQPAEHPLQVFSISPTKIKSSGKKSRRKSAGPQAKRKSSFFERQNSSIETDLKKVDLIGHEGIDLRDNVTVELDSEDFLRIVAVLQCTITGAVFLRGHKFRRTRYMNGMFDNKKNEVCWVQKIEEDDSRPSEIQSLETIPVSQVVKRRVLRFTNQAFPAMSFRDDKGWIVPHENQIDKNAMYDLIEKYAPLTCRVKFVCYYKDARAVLRNVCREKAIFFLREDECDAGLDNKIRDLHLREKWRGKTEFGGSQVGLIPGEKEFLRQEALSHAGKQCSNSLVISGRKYERGDIMMRGTVGDLLIRNDDAGVIYEKLSGVNDASFTHSMLNVATGKEVRALPFDDTTGIESFSVTGPVVCSYATSPLFGNFGPVELEPAFGGEPYHTQSGPSFRSRIIGDLVLNLGKDSHERKSISPDSYRKLTSRHVADSYDMGKSAAESNSNLRRYTFGDCFCGAGGMSRGAVMAGLRVKWGFDFNDIACYSYALNFIGAQVYHEQASIFATSRADQKVDVCHMSPPCQYFSSAHTSAGQDDDANIASFFAVGELLNKTRCRVAVLEQTAGLVNRHEQYFHSCVREFTLRGFDVRWRIIECTDFGLPQRRTRLFMIASCFSLSPGEPLPPFPGPTHAKKPPKGSNLKPWVTINQAIAIIPDGWANHDVDDMPLRNEIPYSGDRVANCVTTGGGEDTLHPSGTRSNTHREFACLQSFPLGHKFGPLEIRKQIGNAVAPIVGEAVLREVVKTLRKTDERCEEIERELERERRARFGGSQRG